MRKNGKISERETLALIHYYGSRIASANGGLAGASRSDVIEWAKRVEELARSMPVKNPMYLAEE